MCKCKFYEVDLAAQKQSDEMEAAYRGSMSEDEWLAQEEWVGNMATSTDEDPLGKCGEYCKHLKSGKGYPGEYVYHCAVPGAEHILHVDFNESEIL